MERLRVTALYKITKNASGIYPVLHIKICTDYRDSDEIVLILEKRREGSTTYHFSPKTHDCLQIEVDENQTITVNVRNHDTVRAGGLWEVRWLEDEQRYGLFEVCSSMVIMVCIEELEAEMEKEEMALMGDAVDIAYKQLGMRDAVFAAPTIFAKEIKIDQAEEVFTQNSVFSEERTRCWHIILLEYTPTNYSTYCLFEVIYRPIENRWTSQLLKEWELSDAWWHKEWGIMPPEVEMKEKDIHEGKEEPLN